MQQRLSGADVRRLTRAGELTSPTPGLALGYVQTNLVVVPRDLAFDFLLFCQRNPKPCPLLDVTEPGSPEPRLVAPGADLRTDVPRYHVYRHGELADEPADLRAWWRDDLVGFLLGCSFTFESALLQAGLPLDKSLATLVELADKPELKAIMGDVLQSVRGGKSFAEALAKHKFFPSIYVNMVRAGEIGGFLDAVLLRRGGTLVNHKKVYRLYREEQLAVRRRKRKKLAAGTRIILAPPTGPNQRWSMDFMGDSLATGRTFRILNIVDENENSIVYCASPIWAFAQ